jgi:SAM-dependent methyltransferase
MVKSKFRALAARIYWQIRCIGGEDRCAVCGASVYGFRRLGQCYSSQWERYGFDHDESDFETFNAETYSCPLCHASDRDRLCALYLERSLAKVPVGQRLRFIDFAPTAPLSALLKGHPCIDYRSADLLMAGVDDHVDICDMKIYGDESFDALICSHVLEHVADDRRAMRELLRILKPGGWAVLLVPISRRLQLTREDPADTDAERWRLYGQNDHVRLYSKSDFETRLRDAGFSVAEFGESEFGVGKFALNGLKSGSILYIGTKQRVPCG